jgi:hypothetical protein
MIRAHQPGSQPIDIPEAIPNPAVPQPVPAPSQTPKEPVKAPAPSLVSCQGRATPRCPSWLRSDRLCFASANESPPRWAGLLIHLR